MASLKFDEKSGSWRVRWLHDGRRNHRRFKSESAAQEFASTVGGVASHPGPTAQPLTPEGIRQIVRDRSRVDGNGCWVWAASGGSNGYAQFTRRVDGKSRAFSAHRLSYEAFVGPIPDGLQIDHLCSVPKCVNPQHLEPVTALENIRRRDERKAVTA